MIEKILKRLKRLTAYARIGLLAVLAVIMLSACGDDRLVIDNDHNDDPFWTENLEINRFLYEVDTDTIPVNQSIRVSGWIIDSLQNPVPNIIVYYTAEPVSTGYFSKSVDTTRADGSFSTTYLPISTGEVMLTVQVADRKIVNKSRTLTVFEGGTGTDHLQNSSFDFEVAGGLVLSTGDDVDISVTIHTDAETPAPNGTVVRLEAGERFDDKNGDGYFTENIDEVIFDANENEIWDKIGTVPAAITTIDSVGTFTYTAGIRSGLVFIRATVGESGSLLVGELVLSLRPNDDVSYIKMSASCPEIQVKATGGIESTNLTAYCYDKYGNPVQQDIPVEFFILSGPNGGENIEEQDYGPVTSKTNVLGAATVSLLSGTISGTIATQAKVGDIYSDVTLINVNAGPPQRVAVGIDPCNIAACAIVNETAEVVALVKDRYSNPVMDNTVVYFTVDSSVYSVGMVDAYSTTVDGIAETIFRSTGRCVDVCVPVIAETDGGRVADTSCFWVSGLPTQVDIYSYPTSLFADGKDKGKIYVEVLDGLGIFVLNDTEVEFEFWPEGTVANASTSDGCHASIAVSELVSAVLSKDYSYSIPDDGIGANGVLTATTGIGAGFSHSVNVQLLTGYSHTDQCEVKIASKVAPGSSEPIVVVIKDRSGNPLSGHLLTAEASAGWISVDAETSDIDSIYTDSYGEAVGLRYYAPPSIGNAYITVTDSDPRGGLIITKKIKIEFDD